MLCCHSRIHSTPSYFSSLPACRARMTHTRSPISLSRHTPALSFVRPSRCRGERIFFPCRPSSPGCSLFPSSRAPVHSIQTAWSRDRSRAAFPSRKFGPEFSFFFAYQRTSHPQSRAKRSKQQTASDGRGVLAAARSHNANAGAPTRPSSITSCR